MTKTNFGAILFISAVLVACSSTAPQPIATKETNIIERPVTVEVTRKIEVAVTRIVEVTPSIIGEPTKETAQSEQPVIPIPLAGPIASRHAEISGMAWYGDWLILMPQYPNFAIDEGDGSLYALRKVDILAYLHGDIEALKALDIPLIAPGLRTDVAGYEGFEAIAFAGDKVFMTIEASPADGMRGYLVSGTMAADMNELVLDTAVLTEIPPQNNIGNKSDEALFIAGDKIVTLFETYGTVVNDNPVAHRFDNQLKAVDAIPFPHIEYRITDATEVDGDGRFWAINYFFPGDTELASETDPLTDQFGQGYTHQQYDYVERLVQFQYHENSIELTDTPPIQLELKAVDARNWEGLVRLDDIGFLLATDKFPETILGFVGK